MNDLLTQYLPIKDWSDQRSLVCVSQQNKLCNYTLGKIYTSVDLNKFCKKQLPERILKNLLTNKYCILNDNNHEEFVDKHHFKTLVEIRDEKLNILLS